MSRSLVGVFILALLQGCVSYTYQGAVSSPTAPVASIQHYGHFESAEPIPFWAEKVQEHEDYFLSKIILKPQIILPNEEQRINLSCYRPKGFKAKYPALILLPITNGNGVTENLAHYFVKRGLIVLRYPSRNELDVLNNEQNALTRFSQIIRDDVMNIKRVCGG